MPVRFGVRQHDAAPHGYRRVIVSVRITERERGRKVLGVSPYNDAHSTLTRSPKPSAEAKPNAAEKGSSGSPPTTI
jgi:hypothetical protein